MTGCLSLLCRHTKRIWEGGNSNFCQLHDTRGTFLSKINTDMPWNTQLCGLSHTCKHTHTLTLLRHDVSYELDTCPKLQGVLPTVWLVDKGLTHAHIKNHTCTHAWKHSSTHHASCCCSWWAVRHSLLTLENGTVVCLSHLLLRLIKISFCFFWLTH